MSYWTYVGMTAVMLVGVCGFVAIVTLIVKHLPPLIAFAILFLAILFLFPLLMMWGRP